MWVQMTYYYKIHASVAKKVRGDPPANPEYIEVTSSGKVLHFNNKDLVEESQIKYPDYLTPEDIETYLATMGKQVAREILFPKSRKKKSIKLKLNRKPVKKCKCGGGGI
jgi:hypothetical protein